MPDKQLPFTTWSHLKGLDLTDPTYHRPHSIEILLGNDVYDDCILSDTHRVENGNPIAKKNVFGYIISGKFSASRSPVITVSSLTTQVEIDQLLTKFWQIEELHSEHVLSNEYQWCEEYYRNTHRRLDNGKYVVRLPLLSQLQPDIVIGASRDIAFKRFLNLERRLTRDSELK
ncbi:uncharacterized protein LOC118745449 [Rhagoletis pomonella]|uniref:uncharacterized protein LOC118745449 n=1 Tax=Rhagoletis pomonella TaxID=28610 RepID=UPI00177C764D|nr:uncharacterized protein LOC118745449 [Rhagoletis pomonella]